MERGLKMGWIKEIAREILDDETWELNYNLQLLQEKLNQEIEKNKKLKRKLKRVKQ